MKCISKSFKINSDSFHLNVKVKMGTKVIIDQRANSLTSNFLKKLLLHMTSFGITDITSPVTDGDTTLRSQIAPPPLSFTSYGFPTSHSTVHFALSHGLAHPALYSINSWDGDLINISHSNSAFIRDPLRSYGHYLAITGSPSYDGVYKILDNPSNPSTLETVLQLEGANFDSQVATGDVRVYPIVRPNYGSSDVYSGRADWRLNATRIMVGASTTPSKIGDFTLFKPHFNSKMEVTALPTVATPSISLDSSTIAISQAYTNQSDEVLSVGEFGLLSTESHANISGASDGYVNRDGTIYEGSNNGIRYVSYLLSRDVVEPFNVQPSGSFTVIYEIETVAQGKEGVVAGFNELLYRQLAQASRTVRNFFNSDHSANQDSNQFFMQGRSLITGRRDYSFFGLQVGTSEDDVDIDDYGMRNALDQNTRIPSFSGDNALLHHGTYLDSFFEDDDECKATFSALFENRGTVNVTVKEIGLTVASAQNTTHPVLLSRNILETIEHQVVEPGKILRVNYDFIIEKAAPAP